MLSEAKKKHVPYLMKLKTAEEQKDRLLLMLIEAAAVVIKGKANQRPKPNLGRRYAKTSS
jgi:hypothetical protein